MKIKHTGIVPLPEMKTLGWDGMGWFGLGADRSGTSHSSRPAELNGGAAWRAEKKKGGVKISDVVTCADPRLRCCRGRIRVSRKPPSEKK